MIRALAVSLLDVDIRIKAVALRTIALFLSHRGIKGRLIEAGAVAGVSNVINSVVPEPEASRLARLLRLGWGVHCSVVTDDAYGG